MDAMSPPGSPEVPEEGQQSLQGQEPREIVVEDDPTEVARDDKSAKHAPRPRHSEGDRHAARRPEGDRQHGPRRPASDLPHTLGRVSLEEVLARHPEADRRRFPRTPRAHLFVTLCHWSMTLLLALNLLSGMRIGWGYEESQLGGMRGPWATPLAAVSPAGTMLGVNLIVLHVWSAFLLLLVAAVYVGYLVRSGSARRLSVTRADLQKLLAGLRSGQFFRSKPALWSANVLVYWMSFLMIAVLTITGVALYRLDLGLSGLFGGYDAVRLLHGLVGYLLIPYTILHATLQWCFGRFWTIFKATVWRSHVVAGLLALAIALPLAAGAYLLDEVPETLTAPRMGAAPAPVLDGDPGDPVWTLARPVTIHTAKATNAPGHVSDITLRAVHDGTHVYFQFQWDDPDASYKRFPLLKTEGGWKVLQTAHGRADETVYYEDKLSMYITKVKNGSCAGTCHLGSGPHSAKGEKHGLHYTSGGETGDVWHWKSVRTNPVGALTGEPGFADDQYFGPPTPVKPGGRYTGGYYPDPDKGGAYAENFVKLDPSKPLAQTYVLPKFLPPSGAARANRDGAADRGGEEWIRRYVRLMFPPGGAVHTDAEPGTSEHGRTWWIHKSEAIPYTKEADTYPVGTLIPNIVIAPLTGDRADVRAKAEWKDGRWTLETRRVLDTGSRYDVAFVPGEAVYITVATYNRAQTRHSEHIKPVRVMLEK